MSAIPDPTPPPAREGVASPPTLCIVGIGASAGGIQALRAFFSYVDGESGAAYAVILHLSPDFDSHLAEVLQAMAAMPVTQVMGPTPIAPNHVYVVPPNRSLGVLDGTFTLSEFTRPEHRRAPVDLFFRSLAESHGSRAACVILSGTGSDGSVGLKRIKEYGGLVIAQDPTEAEYADMPRNAIATGLVDVVLPLAEIPARIAAFFDRERQDTDEALAATVPVADDEMRDVMTVLRVRTGHDFSNYKTATVQRRVERRMDLRGVASMSAYARLIRQEPDEAVALMKELLISVTNFFRDPQVWTLLEERIIPRLFMNKSPQDQVRIWVPGCATGEEAYSIAMLLAEIASATADHPSIQIFATDLDQQAIAVAREGLYTEAEIADVSEERLRRFFHREPAGFRVRRDLREFVLFAQHNVIKDPPFSHLDLICCRNLLIYLNRAIQERVIETFHFALRPGSYLVLGTSESPEAANELFLRIDSDAHVYESRMVTSRIALPFTEPPLKMPRMQSRVFEPRPSDRVFPADLHQRLLEEYAPPSVVVTEEHAIVHMSERAGRYMQVRGGEPSRDLLRLVRPELRRELQMALYQAVKERSTVTVHGIAVALDEGGRRVNLSVRPVLRDDDPVRGLLLVVFDEHAEALEGNVEAAKLPSEPVFLQLEEEITHVKSQLQATIEQYETQAEEAKAANEELQAMNEELRSAAEELETSKEELQSVNEELSTVNQELKIKIDELGQTNNDFQNLIKATDIGTIFVDRSMCVKFSTPRAREVFNLLDTDTGRRLSDITSLLRYDGIHGDIRQVLDKLTPLEREVETENGRWHLMRVLPYRTAADHIEGAVVTFQDITERHEAEQAVRKSEERLRLLIDSALDYAIFTITEEGTVDSWNPGAQRMFGYTAAEIAGQSVDVLFTPEQRAAGVPLQELAEARQLGRAVDERFHLRKDGSVIYCSGVTRQLGNGGVGFAKITRDLTRQRADARALVDAHADLEGRVKQRTEDLTSEVREHQRAELAVTDLLRRLVTAQEDERQRMARDLHDHVGQQLTVLRMTLERAQQASGNGPSSADLADGMKLTSQLGQDLDFLAWQLRPVALDELGLGAALPRFVTEWSGHVGIEAVCRIAGYQRNQLSHDAEVTFYRIAQEALNNVSKHAHPSRIDVVLDSRDGYMLMIVEDDGVGFNVAAEDAAVKGFGLVGMRERAALVGATLQIESTPGKGTSIFLRCPIGHVRDAAGEPGKPGER